MAQARTAECNQPVIRLSSEVVLYSHKLDAFHAVLQAVVCKNQKLEKQ